MHAFGGVGTDLIMFGNLGKQACAELVMLGSRASKPDVVPPAADPKSQNRQMQVQQAIFKLSTEATPDQVAWDHAAQWQTEGAEPIPGIVDYLRPIGYDALNDDQWMFDSSAQDRPKLHLRIKEHVEKDGHTTSFEHYSSHTWYLIECSFTPSSTMRQDAVHWQAPRRLAQLRIGLHDPLKKTMGETYSSSFALTPFARHGGLPGTTSRLQEWFNTLVELLNGDKATPNIVALTLNFFKAHVAIHRRTPGQTNSSASLDGSAWDQASFPEHIPEIGVDHTT